MQRDAHIKRAILALSSGRKAEAFRNFEKSFKKHSNPTAALQLAEMHYSGDGADQSFSKALDYYYQAQNTTGYVSYSAHQLQTFTNQHSLPFSVALLSTGWQH